MSGTDRARSEVARAARGNQPAQEGQTVLQMVEKMQPAVTRLFGNDRMADRFIRVALTVIRTNPQLQSCNPQSLLAALMLSAQLNLEPGPLGHVYYVPFKREVTFIIGYKGLIDLARRSGEIESIEARAVRANDEFEYAYGLEPRLHHRPADGERGELTHVYGVARFKDGGYYYDVLSRSDVEKARMQSQTGRRGGGPWSEHYEAMARKTAVRRMAPYLPLNVEAAQALESDEGVVKGGGLTDGDDIVIDVNAVDLDDDDTPAEETEAAEAVGADD